MSAYTIEAPAVPRKTPLRRIVDVARIQTVNWQALIAWPFGILAGTFLINIVVFAVLSDGPPTQARVTGAVVSIYIISAVTHLQTITQLFPFALGISITRRAFYAGTALVAVVQAMLFGLGLTLLALVERATDGWGLRLSFFQVGFMHQDNLIAQWVTFTVPFIALSAIFVFAGVVFKRWGQPGVFVMGLSFGVLLALLVVVISWQRWWPAVGSFFAGSSPLALFAGYPWVIVVLAGGAGYLFLRRATP
ncbi:hypothetical protein [Pseudonocardia sp. GCM10023141]|uniref:hypothetical protein n=1 Tax=Pseudonocardia sp. GCM10023141 TaxID=3252653 RepID=UPI00360B5576